MVNFELKQKINDCMLYADLISNQGFKPEGELSLREILKFDFLQYCGFLYDSDGSDTREELNFIKEYLGTYMTVNQFVKFRYDRCLSGSFINTVPRSLTYFAKSDLSGTSKRTASGLSKTRFVVTVFAELGQEFISCNGASTTEVSNLTNYSLMLDKFLKEFGLYKSDTPNSTITVDSLRKNHYKPTNATSINKSTASSEINVKKDDNSPATTKKEEIKESLDTLMEELNSLTGLEAVKQDITNLINLIKVKKLREERGMKQPSISLHLVFSGNPGTGKTTVARLLAKIYNKLGVVRTGQLIEVDRSNLVEGYVGQTAIKTAEVIESALGGVLFIDEAYTLTANKGEKDFGQEAVDTLLKAMEDHRDDLIVIVAGYTDLMEEFVNSNPGLKSRFNKYIFFKDYTGKQLTEIFMSMCSKQEYLPDKEAETYIYNYLNYRAKKHDENFANAREVRNYIERCISRQASRIVTLENLDDTTIRTFTIDDVFEEDFKDADTAIPSDIAYAIFDN